MGRRAVLLFIPLVATALLAAVTDRPAEPAVPASQIAFVAPYEGTRQIFVVNTDGTGLRRLTGPPGDSEGPAWSPHGRRLLLVRSEAGTTQVYAASPSGAETNQRLASPGTQPAAAGSPDGHHIAYITRAGPAQSDISLVSLDGAPPRWLAFGYAPNWSPDGTRVAFVVAHVGGGQIYVQDLAGKRSVSLTDPQAISLRPVWSPDGAWIAFLSIHGSDLALWVMHPDGRGQRRLAPAAGNLSVLPVISWTPPQ